VVYILISDRGTCWSNDFRASVSHACSDLSMPASCLLCCNGIIMQNT